MAEQVNSFFKGINQDVSPYKLEPGWAYNSSCFRITTDKGLTSLDLENIKGNMNLISFPEICPFIKIYPTTTNVTQITTLSIADQTSIEQPYIFSRPITSQDIYNIIVNDPGFTSCSNNIYATTNLSYTAYLNELYVLLVPILVSGISCPLMTIITNPDETSYVELIPHQSNLKPIGSTYIRDDIYIFTTNCEIINPTSSVGQIWQLIIDDINITATLTLKYNNYLNFSTYNPIAPTAALGRYENSKIQRIYFTDFYNKFRTLNIANPSSIALDPSILDITPAVDFDIPILTDINYVGASGSIKVGAYQCAYRLKNISGSVTTFSELSNIVYIGSNPGFAGKYSFRYYEGEPAGTTTAQSIGWAINNLDRDFDRIEIVILLRETLNGTPKIILLPDAPITNNDYKVYFDGSIENLSTVISLDEFNTLSGTFTHCKTITTKDNRLFVGNIKSQKEQIDLDTRVYSFDNTSNFKLINNGILSGNLNSSDYNNTVLIPDNSDAINPDRTIYKYKDGGVILGGSGPNISYEFVTVATAVDRAGHYTTSGYNFEIADYDTSPWRMTNPNYTTNSIGLGVNSIKNDGSEEEQIYPNTFHGTQINSGFKYQNVNGLLRGYQRNEIYRFGIQFYDKAKNPYFVKWISDIQFPDYWDNNTNNFYEDGTPVSGIDDFRLSFIANRVGYPECFVQNLGIKFNVTIPEDLQNKISGYTIVRIKRENKDKTIISCGYLNRSVACTVDGQEYLPCIALNNDSGNNELTGMISINNKTWFVTPDIMNGDVITPSPGMNLVVHSLATNEVGDHIYSTGGPQPYFYFKLYTQVPNYKSLTITDEGSFQYGGTTVLGGNTVNNFDFVPVNYPNFGDPADTSKSISIGNQAYYFILNGWLDWTIPNSSNNGKYLAYIKRNISTQYEGSTFTSRANNEYISCSHFRPIRKTNNNITDNFYIYGGDTFVNMYDSCRWTKNLTSYIVRPGRAGYEKSAVIYFPVESSVNTELRSPNTSAGYMNRDFGPSTGSVPNGYEIEMRETYDYNGIYSAENTIRKYFPMPDPYIPNEEFDNRFYASEIKINGELTDSWSIFKPLNYYDVEGSFGPINGVTYLQNDVFFIQDRALGKLLINPRETITTQEGENVGLGRGGILDNHQYISTEIGSKHQFSIIKSGYYIYFYDVRHNKFYNFSQNRPTNPISDMKGLHSWCINNIKNQVISSDKPTFNTNNTYNGIIGVFDFINNEMIYTILTSEGQIQKKYTIVFNELTDSWTSTNYPHYPNLYITNNKYIISPSPSNLKNLYIHDKGNYGEFYDEYFNSDIEYFINIGPTQTKTHTNLEWESEVIDDNNINLNETFNNVYASTDYQQSDIITLDLLTTLRQRFRKWYCEIPRSNVNAAYMSNGFFPKLKDEILKVKLTYINSLNKRFIVRWIKSLFIINKPN